MIRRISLSLLATLFILGLIYMLSPKPVPVESALVTSGLFKVILEEEGKTRVRDHFVISAPIAGILQRSGWHEGDTVLTGQALLKINPLPATLLDSRSKAEAEDRVAVARSGLQTAEANVRLHQAQVKFASADYERLEQMYAKKLLSERELEQARTDKMQAQARLESFRFMVDAARFRLSEALNALQSFTLSQNGTSADQIEIHAPVNGQILKVYQESEGVVAAGQPLLLVGNLAALEAEIELLSIDAVRIQKGMVVEITDWGGDSVLQGQVRLIEPLGFTKVSALGVEEQRVKVIVQLTSEPHLWKGLGAGYRIEAHFIEWQGDSVVQIPESALFDIESGPAVFIVDKTRRLQQRSVKVGYRSQFKAQIKQGLTVGERVVLFPDSTLTTGQTVKLN